MYKQKFYYKDIGLNIYLYKKKRKEKKDLFVNNKKKKIYLLVTII